MEIDAALLNQGTLFAFGLVFLGGIVTSIGPCNLAMVPLLVGYIWGTAMPGRGRAFTLSLAFAIGLATTFMLFGGSGSAGWEGLYRPDQLGLLPAGRRLFCFGVGYVGALDIQVPAEIAHLRMRIGWKSLRRNDYAN